MPGGRSHGGGPPGRAESGQSEPDWAAGGHRSRGAREGRTLGTQCERRRTWAGLGGGRRVDPGLDPTGPKEGAGLGRDQGGEVGLGGRARSLPKSSAKLNRGKPDVNSAY